MEVELMLIRAVGAFAVMLGCGGLGFYFAAKEGFRVQELLEFKKALLILSSEIEYMRAPLAVACGNIAKRTGLTISKMFDKFSEFLKQGEGESAYQLWLNAMDTIAESSFLAEEDIDVLEGFGKTLGYLDKNMQQNAIDYAINYIENKVGTLQIQSDKNKKMYRSLGAIVGLLIIVVLW